MADQQEMVVVKDLHKSFRLPLEARSGLKDVIIHFFNRKKGYTDQKILNDVSFTIKKGEFYGIVGRNGSGKSTLLKLLAGIYVPTRGYVGVNGSLTPFIELGVGFNPELTGRENVYLNGALLGFGRAAMEEMYDDIVKFAELDQFMDQKLKNYSSGMQVRLAFSIAIRARSDILLIDEVLAVGDAAFQQKCFDYFDQLKREKRTIIFVSHDMQSVRRYCDKALYIKDGKVVKIGTAKEIAALYNKENDERSAKSAEDRNDKAVLSELKINISHASGSDDALFDYREKLHIELRWNAEKLEQPPLNVGVALFRDDQVVYGTNTLDQDIALHDSITLDVELNLSRGKYKVVAGLFGKGSDDVIVFNAEGPEFFVGDAPTNPGSREWEGITQLNSEWKVR